MKYDVFISYSRKDSAVADLICSALSEAGISFFLDKEGISAGENFPEVLASTIDSSHIFLLLASENAYKSKFTKAEILYAFNHMRSGCIIPYILDKSEMPADLEFLLGNVNWIQKSSCPPEKLPAEIRTVLESPDTGTIGGRKVRSKWPLRILLIAVAAAVSALAFTLLHQNGDKVAALQDYKQYERLISKADSLQAVAAGKASLSNTIETTSSQIADLKAAGVLLSQSDSIKRIHASDEHIALFNINTDNMRRAINVKLDSMFTTWSDYAKESFELYNITHSSSECQNALDCLEHALSIKTDDKLESSGGALASKSSAAQLWSDIYSACHLRTKSRSACGDFEGARDALAKAEHRRWNIDQLLMNFRPLTEGEQTEVLASGSVDKQIKSSLKRARRAHLDICSWERLEEIDPEVIDYDYHMVDAARNV